MKVGITHGDINGISYEIIFKTLIDKRILKFCTPVIYGSSKAASYHRTLLNLNNIQLNNIKKIEDASDEEINIIDCIDDNINVEIGRSTKASGISSFQALERATEDWRNKKMEFLLTAPINKYNINSENFKFPGHTEYLGNRIAEENQLMFLVNEDLKVAVVTGHIPVQKIHENITKENILKKLNLLNFSLKQDFGIALPRIAVLGLNPHSGDNGIIGKEEIDIIIPALEEARENKILSFGPYASDGFFASQNYKKFDAILAMYHDQGLIPFKLLAFKDGVNFTAGLSLIRTSPAHGTAYEIAGKGIAHKISFMKALFLGIDIYKNRISYKKLNENKLKI